MLRLPRRSKRHKAQDSEVVVVPGDRSGFTVEVLSTAQGRRRLCDLLDWPDATESRSAKGSPDPLIYTVVFRGEERTRQIAVYVKDVEVRAPGVTTVWGSTEPNDRGMPVNVNYDYADHEWSDGDVDRPRIIIFPPKQ